MKKFAFLLSAVSLWGCGGDGLEPRFENEMPLSTVAQSVECAECREDTSQSSVSGTHGYEINVPIGDRAYLPSDWSWVNVTDVGSFVSRQDQAKKGTMDWGGGNVLYNVSSPSRPPLMTVLIEKGNGYQVVGHVTGIFDHIQPGLVRGSTALQIEQDSQPVPAFYQDLELALQVQNGPTWSDVTTRTLHTGWSPYPGEIEATVQPGTPVRMEIRALRSPSYEKMVYLTTMRLFGAQCYPDFANPGNCL